METITPLEAQTRTLLSELDSWLPADLSYRPRLVDWSALQVLEHLVKTEEEILVLAREGARNPHPIGVRDRLGFLFVMRVFQTDQKVKTPSSAAQVLPGPELALSDLRERWQKTRADFRVFQEQLHPRQARHGLFRHPVIGWMGTRQIIEFFWVHIIHHGFQMKRLRDQLQLNSDHILTDFPKSH